MSFKVFSVSQLLKVGSLVFFSFLTIACGGGNEQGFLEAVEVNANNIVSIDVAARDNSVRVQVDETQKFIATATLKDGAERDISDLVRWYSSDKTIVSIDSSGVATGLANGTVDITARLSDLSDSASITASDAELVSIAISNPNTALSLCSTAPLPLKATGTYADNATDDISDKVSWVSSNGAIVFVGNDEITGATAQLRSEKGVISSVGPGSAFISASHTSVSGTEVSSQENSFSINVVNDLDSIAVSAPDEELFANETYNFTATGTYGSETQDISDNVQWVSGDDSLLTFSNGANPASALEEGTGILVTASCDPAVLNISESVNVDVKPARELVGVVVKFDGAYYEDGDLISANVNDADMQLELYLLYSDGESNFVDESEDLAEDSDTVWSYESLKSGEQSDIDEDSGLISIEGEGLNEYEVLHVIGTDSFSMNFLVKVDSN